MPAPVGVRNYLLNGIESTPLTLRALLGGLSADSPLWDARPDPARFTLREMLAHVADWDPVFLGRLERMRDEDNPLLPDIDEGALCQERRYGAQDPLHNLDRLTTSRPGLVQAFRALSDDQWERPGHKSNLGDITVFQLAVTVLGHDSYHLRQAAEFVRG